MSAAGRSRVVTEPLGGSPLSVAIQTRRLPHELQPWAPATPDEWRDQASRVRSSTPAAWYDALAPALSASGNAAARLERAASEPGVVVTTGQQAALFGGPLYTLAKALTALELADAVERDTGIPTAPVFWAATDDADFLEARAAHVADANGLVTLAIESPPPAGTPMSRFPLPDMTPLLQGLRRACGSAAYARFYEITHRAFTEQPTLGTAYVRLLRELLEPLGIAVLDSSSDAYHQATRDLLLRALGDAERIATVSAERAAALRAAGFEPQVLDDRGLSLVYAVEDGIKRRIPVSEARAVAMAREARVPLAPNVLLRPVVERYILPTVAYVAGPAELAYFSQSSVVADALGVPAPVGVPRWSGTIIEPFAERALRRLGIDYREARDRPALERRLATASVPPSVAAAWQELETRVRESGQHLGRAVQEHALMAPEVIQGLERSLFHKLGRTERRLLAAVKRRDERVRHDVEVVSGALYPFGSRQERVLNYVPMLARGGEDLLDDMRSRAREHARLLVRAPHPEAAATR